MAALLPLLQGCGDSAGGLAVSALLGLAALGLTAFGAYALGTTRQRLRSDAELREARSQWRLQGELHEGQPWQTDGRHRLQLWNGTASPPAEAVALFADAALQARLQAQRAFSPLRVQLPQALQGSRAWALRAAPRHDDLGAFCGHVGIARPLDAEEADASLAAAVAPCWRCTPGQPCWRWRLEPPAPAGNCFAATTPPW